MLLLKSVAVIKCRHGFLLRICSELVDMYFFLFSVAIRVAHGTEKR